jgi:hypothetical protein
MTENGLNYKFVPAALACALIWALSCGEPLGPLPNSWRMEAELEEGPDIKVEGLAAASGAVYAALTRFGEQNELAIVVYRDGRFKDDWVLPDAGPDGGMRGIGKIGAAVWAGGTRTELNGELRYFPVFVRNAGAGWQEVDLGSSPGIGGVGRVLPISENACWLLTGEEDPGPWYGALTLYDNGTLRTFPQFRYATAAYDAAAHTLYVIPDRKGSAPVDVAITRDRGASWVYEKTVLESFPGADPARADILPPIVYRHDLIFTLSAATAGGGTWTYFYRRTGAPGAGEYELSFFSNIGPFFRSVTKMAVDDSPRLVAVGVDTCLVYDGTQWRMERIPYKQTSFNALAADELGFYATARNDTTDKFELLHHP